MQITQIRTWKSDKPGAIVGSASVTFDEQLIVTGMRIISGNKGMFASFPQKKVGNDYKDVVFSPDKNFGQMVKDAVIREFQAQHPQQSANPYDQTPYNQEPPQQQPSNAYADQQNFGSQNTQNYNNAAPGYQQNELPLGQHQARSGQVPQPAYKSGDNPWGLMFGPWNGPERIAMSNDRFSKDWMKDKEAIKKLGYVTYKDPNGNWIVKQHKQKPDDFAGGAPMGAGNPQ